jgi:hypothetical protein
MDHFRYEINSQNALGATFFEVLDLSMEGCHKRDL